MLVMHNYSMSLFALSEVSELGEKVGWFVFSCQVQYENVKCESAQQNSIVPISLSKSSRTGVSYCGRNSLFSPHIQTVSLPYSLLPPRLSSAFQVSSSRRLCLAVRLSFSIIGINIISASTVFDYSHLRLHGWETAARHIYIQHYQYCMWAQINYWLKLGEKGSIKPGYEI